MVSCLILACSITFLWFPFWTSSLLALLIADFLVKAAVLALMTRDENVSGVVGQVLNVPVTCHPKHFPADKYEHGSYQQNKDAPVVDAPKMDWFWGQYLPKVELEVCASFLLVKDLSKLPLARKCLI